MIPSNTDLLIRPTTFISELRQCSKIEDLKPVWAKSCYTATLEDLEKKGFGPLQQMRDRLNYLLDSIIYDLSPNFDHCPERKTLFSQCYVLPEVSFTLRSFITLLIAALKRRGVQCTPFLVGSSFNHVLTGSKYKDADIRFYLEAPTFVLAKEAYMEAITHLIESTSEYINNQFPVMDSKIISDAYFSVLKFIKEENLLLLGLPGIDVAFVYHPSHHSVSTFDGGQLCLETWNGTYLIRISRGEIFCQSAHLDSRAEEVFNQALEDIKIRRFPILNPQKIRNLIFRLLSCASKRVEIDPKIWMVATVKLFEETQTAQLKEILKHLSSCYGSTAKVVDILNLLSHVRMHERECQLLANCVLKGTKELGLEKVDYFLRLIRLKPKITIHLLNVIRGLCLYKWALKKIPLLEHETKRSEESVPVYKEASIEAYAFDDQSLKPIFYFSLPHKNGTSHLCIPQGYTPIDLIRDFLASWPELEQMMALQVDGIENLRDLLNCLGLDNVPLNFQGESETAISKDRLQIVQAFQALPKQTDFLRVWELFNKSFDPTLLLDMLKPSLEGKDLFKFQQDRAIVSLNCYLSTLKGGREKSLTAFLSLFLNYVKGSIECVNIQSVKRLRFYLTDFLNGAMNPNVPSIKGSLILLAPLIFKTVLIKPSLPILKEANLLVELLSHTNCISKETVQESMLMILAASNKLTESTEEEGHLTKEWSYNFICQILKNRVCGTNKDLIEMCNRLASSMNPACLVIAFDHVDQCLDVEDQGEGLAESQANLINNLLCNGSIFEIPQLDLRCCETFLLVAESYPKIFSILRRIGGALLEERVLQTMNRLSASPYFHQNDQELYWCITFLAHSLHPSNLTRLQQVFDCLLPESTSLLISNPALECPYSCARASIALLRKKKSLQRYQKRALLEVALLLIVSYKKTVSADVTNREVGKELLRHMEAIDPSDDWKEILKTAFMDKMVIALSNSNRVRASELFRKRVEDFCEQLENYISEDAIKDLQKIAAKNLVTQNEVVVAEFLAWAAHLNKRIIKTSRFINLKNKSHTIEKEERPLVSSATIRIAIDQVCDSIASSKSISSKLKRDLNSIVDSLNHLQRSDKILDPKDLQSIQHGLVKLLIALTAQASEKSLDLAKRLYKNLLTSDLWNCADFNQASGLIMNGYQVLVVRMLQQDKPNECRVALHHALTILSENKDNRDFSIITPFMGLLRKFINQCGEEELPIVETVLKTIHSYFINSPVNEIVLDLCFDYFSRCHSIEEATQERLHLYQKNLKFLEGLIVSKKEIHLESYPRLESFLIEFLIKKEKSSNDLELYKNFINFVVNSFPRLTFKTTTIQMFLFILLQKEKVLMDSAWVLLQKYLGVEHAGVDLDLKCLQFLSLSFPMIKRVRNNVEKLVLQKWNLLTSGLSSLEKIPFNDCLIDIATKPNVPPYLLEFITIAITENFSFKQKYELLKKICLCHVLPASAEGRMVFIELFHSMIESRSNLEDVDVLELFQYVFKLLNFNQFKDQNLLGMAHTLISTIVNRFPVSLIQEYHQFICETIEAYAKHENGAKLVELNEITKRIRISSTPTYWKLFTNYTLAFDKEYTDWMHNYSLTMNSPSQETYSSKGIAKMLQRLRNMLPIMKTCIIREGLCNKLVSILKNLCLGNQKKCDFGMSLYELMQEIDKLNFFILEGIDGPKLLAIEREWKHWGISLLVKSQNLEILNLVIDRSAEFYKARMTKERMANEKEAKAYKEHLSNIYEMIEEKCLFELMRGNASFYLKLTEKFQTLWVTSPELMLFTISKSNLNACFLLNWLKTLSFGRRLTGKTMVKEIANAEFKLRHSKLSKQMDKKSQNLIEDFLGKNELQSSEKIWEQFKGAITHSPECFVNYILSIIQYRGLVIPNASIDKKLPLMKNSLGQMSVLDLQNYSHEKLIFEMAIKSIEFNKKYLGLIEKLYPEKISLPDSIETKSTIHSLERALLLQDRSEKKSLAKKIKPLKVKV